MSVRLTWDVAAGAGYLALTPITAGEAVSQVVVENPVAGVSDVVLDFDRDGRLLGVEFLGAELLPHGLTSSGG